MSIQWKHIESARRVRWKKDCAQVCYIGIVYYVLRQRSSYNWSWSSNYFWSNAFHPSLDAAQSCVEPRRERGSAWTIDEWPCLVIAGERYGICVATTKRQRQFTEFAHVDFRRKTLRLMAIDFEEWASKRTYLYRVALDVVEPLSRGLARFESRSWSSQYRLSWPRKSAVDVNLDQIFDVQKAIWGCI